MRNPVEIAYRRYQPSDRVRAEIGAQTERLAKFGPDVTHCRVVVTGPGGGRAGVGVQLRLALPGRREVVAEGRAESGAEPALDAVREAFETARRRVGEAEREMHGDVKTHAPPARAAGSAMGADG